MQNRGIDLKTTKAETLNFLHGKGFNIPQSFFFNHSEWMEHRNNVIERILNEYKDSPYLAVRSSSQIEDSETSSMAGAFCSLLNIEVNKDSITRAIERVIASFSLHENCSSEDQVLVQEMVTDVIMSGVAMSKVLDDGSPYYVINFDDSSGRTDSITSGTAINKTVYIYNGVHDKDFDSPHLKQVISLVRSLENIYQELPLDIEFAIDKENTLHLLQVRRICATANWNKRVSGQVSEQIEFVYEYVSKLMKRRYNLFGNKTVLGVMPDWNPAEMIGIVPRPLAISLYRTLITKDAWCLARKEMGYRQIPNTDLMVLVSGHPYIDVRCSLNSFLPSGIVPEICEKLVNAWLERLNSNPHFHDKIEFDIVHTVLDFSFKKSFHERYKDVLTEDEFRQYEGALRHLTGNAIKDTHYTTLDIAENAFEKLVLLQKNFSLIPDKDPFIIADYINSLLDECKMFGTIPFAIAARHAFIAEVLLRSAVSSNAISEERVHEFKKSINTVTKIMGHDFYRVFQDEMTKDTFLEKYGHLRPSTYDILSPSYKERKTIFSGEPLKVDETAIFILSEEEKNNINSLLKNSGFADISAENLFNYAARAIRAREYGKFVFTKHISHILDNVALWGEFFGLDRNQLSLLTIEQIRGITYNSLPKKPKEYLLDVINKAKDEYELAQSFKLSYLIRSGRDVYVVPQQRTAPNFITRKSIESYIVFLPPDVDVNMDLSDCIICIEGADPGYDWIFSRNIAGLVTKFGGANSHMAIRCAEYDLPAAIGCGEQTFERIINAKACLINCSEKILRPVVL